MKVICVSGKAQHGKDSFASLLAASLVDYCGKTVRIFHYADLLKHICRTYFDWNGEKDEVGRTLLQRVGTDVIRSQEPDYWVDEVIHLLRLFPNEWDYVIIPDCRFPNEVDKVKEYFESVHIRVIRPGYKSQLTVEQQNHISETALDNSSPDIIVYNDGAFFELVKKAAEIAKEL